MKKGSIIILSIFAILTLIVWFSCNPMQQQNRQSATFNVLDSNDQVRASGLAIGYGNGATGGAGGSTVTVTTTDEWLAAVDTVGPLTIQVSGAIDSHNPSVRSDKTIIGIGSGASLLTGMTIPRDSTNIIVQNLTISDPESDDGITILGQNIWVDHCTFVDCADGMADVTKGGNFVTISWCKFYYTGNNGHNFCNLISSSDSDTGDYYVTFHHNWWTTNCVERMPSVRYGHVHVFNNYYNCTGNNYCVRTRISAQILVENNYFENVQNPWERYITSGTPGLLHASGNVLVNTTTVTASDREIPDGTDVVFTPSYPYTLDAGSSVKASVMAGAGAH